ncbi:MAG: hypothetical protein QM760_04930 [Nibricoccus sp.]
MKLLPTFSLLLASAILASAALNTRTYSTGAQSVALNGFVCPEVTGWSGGDIAGTVTQSNLGGVTKKHISAISYDPIVVESALPLSPALADCLANFLAGKSTPRNLILTTADASGKPESSLVATNAILEEVQFPQLDGSSKEPFRALFIFRADAVKASTPETLPSAGKAMNRNASLASNFRLSIDGLPTSRVASIEAFTIKSAARPAGTFNAQPQPISPNISNLTLAISQADRAGWTAWRDSFLVQGNSQDTAEKSGTLELLGADMKSVLFTLKFSNLGLIRLSTPPAESGGHHPPPGRTLRRNRQPPHLLRHDACPPPRPLSKFPPTSSNAPSSNPARLHRSPSPTRPPAARVPPAAFSYPPQDRSPFPESCPSCNPARTSAYPHSISPGRLRP